MQEIFLEIKFIFGNKIVLQIDLFSRQKLLLTARLNNKLMVYFFIAIIVC